MERFYGFLDNLAQDFRFAARTLSKAPAFTAIAALSIALGIGANTAIFSLIDAVMWRILPVRDPAALWVAREGMTFHPFPMLHHRPPFGETPALSALPLHFHIEC